MDSRHAGDEPLLSESTPSFGYLLRRLRKAADLTQRELGQRVGCATDTIHKIETEARRPSQAVAERLAEAFGLVDHERATFIQIARADRAPGRLALPTRPHFAPTPALPQSSLPAPMLPLVGRERELALLAQLLAAPGTRLVTLCGLGGVGKTRLALAAAEHRRVETADGAPRFAHGVFFIDLSGLSSPAQLVSALAVALGLPLEPGPRSPRRQLCDYLRRRQLLLILDNYDHMVKDVALIKTILAEAPGITMLVTSRERLQLQSEHLLMIEGLDAPADEAGPDLEAYASVQLFLQAARRARPDFAPDQAGLRAIAAICHMVEGLPLALELAAAWVALLTPADILSELRRGGDLLRTELRDVPERQRSLQMVCTAAWRGLSPPARTIFARLSVFRGGFTLAAAQQVAATDLATLAGLIGQALLRYSPARTRFDLHELLRQYAAARLDEEPAAAATTRQRHATYYLQLLVARASELQGAGQLAAQAALGAEDENLHAAWAYALAAGLTPLLDLAADALGRYYEWQGYQHEGLEAFSQAVATLDGQAGVPERLHARLLTWRAAFRQPEEDYAAVLPDLERSLALLERAEEPAAELRSEHARALRQLARLHAASGDDEPDTLYRQAIALFRAGDQSWELGATLDDLGDLLRAAGQLSEAEAALREARAIQQRVGDRRGLAQTLQLLSQVCLGAGRYAEAERQARQALALARSSGSRAGMAAALGRLGAVQLQLGRGDEAVALLALSHAHYEHLGDQALATLAQSRLALALRRQGAHAASGRHAAEAAEAVAAAWRRGATQEPWATAHALLAQLAAP